MYKRSKAKQKINKAKRYKAKGERKKKEMLKLVAIKIPPLSTEQISLDSSLFQCYFIAQSCRYSRRELLWINGCGKDEKLLVAKITKEISFSSCYNKTKTTVQ